MSSLFNPDYMMLTDEDFPAIDPETLSQFLLDDSSYDWNRFNSPAATTTTATTSTDATTSFVTITTLDTTETTQIYSSQDEFEVWKNLRNFAFL